MNATAYSACQTCGTDADDLAPGDLTDNRVVSPLIGGGANVETVTLCPACRGELERQDRIGFAAGLADRQAGRGCLSAHGAYLDGWYSVPEPEPVAPLIPRRWRPRSPADGGFPSARFGCNVVGMTGTRTLHPSASAEDSRLAAIAARKAARASRPAFAPVTVRLGDVQPGDFIDRIVGELNLPTYAVGAAVVSVKPDYSWRERVNGRVWANVPAVLVTYRVGSSTDNFALPAHLMVQARRPVVTH